MANRRYRPPEYPEYVRHLKPAFLKPAIALAVAVVVLGILWDPISNRREKKVTHAITPSVVRPAVESAFHTLGSGDELWFQAKGTFSWFLHEGETFYVRFYDNEQRPARFRLGGEVVGPGPILIERKDMGRPFTFSRGYFKVSGPKEGISVVEIRQGE